MTPSAAWRLLEIDAGADSKTVRRAYAAKLRAIDPDQDREAFTALREARDRALAMAARAVDGNPAVEKIAAPAETADEIELILPCPSLPMAAPIIAAPAGALADISGLSPTLDEDWQMPLLAPGFRASDESDDAIDLALPQGHDRPFQAWTAIADNANADRPDQALYALLHSDPEDEASDTPLTQAEVAGGLVMLDHIHAEVQQGAIDLYARAEGWLAHLLASSWPRSHPLLHHAAALFGWATLEGKIDALPAVDYINCRLASDRFAEAVQQKPHPLHSAWRQLSKPTRPGQSRALWWQGNKIDELLVTIRRDHPEIERRLDWHRIAMWEAHRARPIRWWTITVGAIFALQMLFRIATAFYHAPVEEPSSNLEPPSLQSSVSPEVVPVKPRVPGGLGDVDADMKAALLAALGPDATLETLRARAPLVLQLFESNWRLNLDMGRTRSQYAETMARVIRERYALLARQAGGDRLIALQRQRLKEEKQLKGVHWRECAEAGAHGGLTEPALLSPDVRAANQHGIEQVILAMPANPDRPAPAGTFPIPGKIVERTLEISGLTLDQVSAAFMGKGNDREKCLTHIALLEAVLATDASTRAKLITHL